MKNNKNEFKIGFIAGICVVSAIMKSENPKQAAIELMVRAKELGLC